MNTKSVVIFLFVIVAIGLGLYFWGSGSNQSVSSTPPPLVSPVPSEESSNSTNKDSKVENTNAMMEGNTVEITSEGFVPSEIKIKAGETVIWENKDSSPHWPATAAHPTHTVYPGSDISKCGTPEQSSIFDACKGLTTGENYSFKFDQKGNWKYHDHLNARAPFFGSVVVE